MSKDSSTHASQIRLLLEVKLWRYGYGWLVLAILAMLFLAIQFLALPNIKQERSLVRKQLQQLQLEQENLSRNTQMPVPVSKNRKILDQLSSISISEADFSNVLRRIAEMAQYHGVGMSQSEYQSSTKGHGGLTRLQVTLPLRTSYPQLKQFIEQVLFEFPGVSLDELVLKRESVAQNQAEVRVKLSLWIQP